MVDNSRAKSHLESVRSTLADVDKPNDIKSIITKTSLDLLNNLSDYNLFIDNEIIAWLTAIEWDLQNGRIWARVRDQITILENERTTLMAGGGGWWWGGWWGWNPFQGRISEIGSKITALNIIADNSWNLSTSTTDRHAEYNDLLTNAQRFNLSSNIPDQTINVAATPIAWPNIDLSNFLTGTPPTPTYLLCDENGSEIAHTGLNYKIQIWWTEYTLWNVEFTWNHLNLTHLTVNPRITDLPQTLNLSITARYPVSMGTRTINVACNKKIKINLSDWSTPLSAAWRRTAYNNLRPPMNDRIASEYSDNYRENLENEAIWRILREWWNETEVNEIYNNETRRNLLQNRMRALLNRYFPSHALTLRNLQAEFRRDMTRLDRDVPSQYLVSINTFSDYIRRGFPDTLRDFASWRIHTIINSTIHNQILREFTTFQADVTRMRVDNYDNLRVLARVPNDNNWPQWHPDSRWQRVSWRWSRKNNYTKFFQWRSAEIKDQSLETEDWTINYGVNVEVLWVNKIVATINIDWKEEPEIIEAANHDRLIRWILNRANTKDGEPLNRKLRCNIALSVLKAMVMMSPQSLSRQIRPTNFTDNQWNVIRCNRIEADIHWWNLRIRGWSVNVTWPTRRTRRNVTIFDEASFKSLHNVNDLENWVYQLSTQINSIMNATADEYNQATNTILRNKSLRTYNTKQFLRFWPVKRLWWRIVHWKTNDNFDFETSVDEAWKSVNIAFSNWLFTVSWEFDWQEYSYQAKDLWSILRKKINRKRVFDWIELAMVATINEEYVEKLRTNNLIQTESFAVSDFNDNKTWRVYIFDEWWNLSYLDIEDRRLNPLRGRKNAWRIDPWALPTERIRCNDRERREFFQNPFLAWRLIREMRRRLALF